jgi:hypothetical protein
MTANPAAALHHLASEYRSIRLRLRIMKQPAGFSAIATANAARASSSVRQLAGVS